MQMLFLHRDLYSRQFVKKMINKKHVQLFSFLFFVFFLREEQKNERKKVFNVTQRSSCSFTFSKHRKVKGLRMLTSRVLLSDRKQTKTHQAMDSSGFGTAIAPHYLGKSAGKDCVPPCRYSHCLSLTSRFFSLSNSFRLLSSCNVA